MRDEQDREPALSWEEWPGCPGCNRRRQCICPICQTAGADFPLADYQAVAAPLIPSTGAGAATRPVAAPADVWPLLHCPTCDEVFRPRFYERCHACGYRFHEGISLQPPPADGLVSRVLIITAVLLGLASGLFLYFGWLLRS